MMLGRILTKSIMIRPEACVSSLLLRLIVLTLASREMGSKRPRDVSPMTRLPRAGIVDGVDGDDTGNREDDTPEGSD